jgi:hypothetical protein
VTDRLGFRWTTREEHPLGTHHLYQRFVSPKSSLYPISRPTLVASRSFLRLQPDLQELPNGG